MKWAVWRGRDPWLLLVIAAFIVSRLGYSLAGVRFDVLAMEHGWYILDLNLLRTNLLQSLLYMHIQPPLQNLYIGVVLKLFPERWALVFHLSYLALGFLGGLALYLTQKRLGVPPALASLLTVLYLISPASILYENWFHYTYPVAMLLLGAAFFLIRFLQEGRWRDGFAFFGLLAAVGLIRSTYHLVWLLGVAAMLALFAGRLRRRALLAALLPLLLVAAWYGKNLVVFGQFANSTWMGLNLAKATIFMIPSGARQEMVANGELSEIVLLDTFLPLEAYERFIQPAPPTGIPVLDQRRNTFGEPNYNHIAYLQVSQLYLQDALTVVLEHPAIYRSGLLFAWEICYRSPTDYIFIADNRQQIAGINALYDRFYYGKFGGLLRELLPDDFLEYVDLGRLSYFSLLNLLLAAGLGVWSFWRLAFGKAEMDRAALLAVLFVCVTIVFTILVSNTLEASENNRYRFESEPLAVMAMGYLWGGVWRRLRVGKSRQPGV